MLSYVRRSNRQRTQHEPNKPPLPHGSRQFTVAREFHGIRAIVRIFSMKVACAYHSLWRSGECTSEA